MASFMAEHPDFVRQCCWCAFYGGGLIVSLVGYGLLQERVMTVRYGDELFGTSIFFVFCNRIAAVVFSLAMAVFYRESFLNKAPLWKYLIISLSNVYASTAQYESLKYLTFVVQMLGKSFKMMPVMVWGMIISRKSYTAEDWLVALAVTLGSTEFLVTGPITSDSTGTPNALKGLLFLLLFLALDGITSTMQEKLFKEYKTSKYNQMMYVNGMSAVVSLVTMLVAGNFVPSLAFAGRHPPFLGNVMLLSVCAVAGQFFIYSQIKEFGALVFAATMNVRQVVSILVSYVTYGHYITPLQILGLVVIFGALFFKSFRGFQSQPTKAETQPLADDGEKGN